MTLRNLTGRRSFIELATLRGNFRDAVFIAVELGIQHV